MTDIFAPDMIGADARDAPKPLVAAVIAALPELSGRAWRELTGGRSNKLWQVGAVVVKLYDPATASPLFPNDPLAEAMVLRALHGTGLAPALLAEGDCWIAYGHKAGRAWSGGVAQVAGLMGRLHQTAAPPGLRPSPLGSAALREHARTIAHELLNKLPPLPDDPGLLPVAGAFIHGDAVSGNIIEAQDGLTLIDWQCPALGEPSEDIAAFLSPAMQWLYGQNTLSPAQVQVFLGAYPRKDIIARYQNLAPILHWRIAAHCAWKVAKGHADYAKALELEVAGLPG